MTVLTRRRLLAGLGLAVFAAPARAHTPYRQWVVYRKKHLLIGSCRADPESYPLGKKVAELLARELPESKARPARAPDQERLASLITTGQLQVVLLAPDEARDLALGVAPFADYGPYPLRTLFDFGSHVLVAGQALPDHHAWLVARVLVQAWPERAGHLRARGDELPLHPGVQALLAGRPMPPAAVAVQVD